MEINHPVFKLVVAVAVLLALLFVAVKLSNYTATKNGKQQVNEPPKTLEVKQVTQDKLPDKFPTDLPIEDGATITQNFNATEADGRFNATREFESKKTLPQNLTLYTQYLKNNGWEIKATLDQPTIKMVMGQQGNQQLQITIAENPTTQANVVTISLTEFK